jgi:hypothetical protein
MPGQVTKQRDVGVVGAELAQLAFAVVDLLVEGVDQAEADGERRCPRLGPAEPLEQPSPASAEQVAGRVGDAMLEEDRMDAVLQRAAVLDQVQPEAGPLPLGAHRRVGQPDLRDQVEAGELGQHEAVDLVCFAGKRRQPRAFAASAIRTSQPCSSSGSWTKRAPLIDSITANTGSASPSRSTRPDNPSRSGGTAPRSNTSPPPRRASKS